MKNRAQTLSRPRTSHPHPSSNHLPQLATPRVQVVKKASGSLTKLSQRSATATLSVEKQSSDLQSSMSVPLPSQQSPSSQKPPSSESSWEEGVQPSQPEESSLIFGKHAESASASFSGNSRLSSSSDFVTQAQICSSRPARLPARWKSFFVKHLMDSSSSSALPNIDLTWRILLL